MKSQLERRVAVIVGGSGQIGRVIAEHFLREGCRVAIVSRGTAGSAFLENWDRDARARTTQYRANVGDEREVKACLASINGELKQIDFLIYTPGLPPDTDVPLAMYPTAKWEQTFGVYVTGLFLFFRETLPYLGDGGHIVVLSSAATRFRGDNLPPFFAGHYAAAKAAVNEFCKWARREAHERSVLLSRIAPAAVDVPFHRNAPPNRRPPAMIPVDVIASKVVRAAIDGIEIDEELVPTPMPAN
jgi:3-oxoacyl-[acyl-carrier protein] reductase